MGWMLGVLKHVISDEFFAVSVPQTISIQSRRLGMLYRSMQVMTLGLVIAYCMQTKVGFLQHNLQPWGVKLLADSSGGSMGKGAMPSYCVNPGTYVHKHSEQQIFAPNSCKKLHGTDAYNVDNSALLFHTLVQDVTVWDEFGDACSNQVAPWCLQNSTGGRFQSQGNGTNSCSCTVTEEFLVQSPEEQQITLFLGFAVDLSRGRMERIQHAGIGDSDSDFVSMSDTLTVFQREDGHRCQVGGRKHWKYDDVRHGIRLTLGELLACADVHLDAPPQTRTMGLTIHLGADYSQDLAGRMTCQITVIPALGWTRAPLSSDFVRLAGGIGAKRTRGAHSVAITAMISGRIYTFNWPIALRGIIDVAVMTYVPDAFVGFIALYCMGLVSEIYRRATRTKLSMFAMFHSAAAKLMLAEVAFRGLIGGIWQGSAPTLGGLTPSMLLRHMKEVFHDHMMDGTLPEEELRRMSAVIFDGMDKKKAGKITCIEFIHALTDDGNIDVRQMAKMFGNDNMPGVQHLGQLVGCHLNSPYDQRLIATGSATPRNSGEYAAQDAEHLIPAACMHKRDTGDPELRLAALEDLGRRMEGRVTALERNQEHVAAIDIEGVARDCLFISNTAGIVETLHSEFQTLRNDLETRLQAMEQVLRLEHQHYHEQCQPSKGSEQPEEPGELVCHDSLQATPEHAVEPGKTSSNMPKPSILGSASRRMFASPRMRSVSAVGAARSMLASPRKRNLNGQLSPSMLSLSGQTSRPPSHFSVQCNNAAARGGGSQRGDYLVLVDSSCREIRRKNEKPTSPARAIFQREASPANTVCLGETGAASIESKASSAQSATFQADEDQVCDV